MFLPRYHPQFARRRPFGADTPQMANGITRLTLLKCSGSSSREKARYATHAAPTVPHSLKECNRYQTARSSLLYVYHPNITITPGKMQAENVLRV